MKIRLAVVADLAAINAIYNHYVACSTCTYQTQPATEEERLAWFAAHGPRYPVLVAERDADGTSGPAAAGRAIIGWASLSPFHPRQAYRFTVENSVYVHPEHLRQGIGRALLAELFERARALDYRTVIAIISADQAASIALHTRAGFREAGRLLKVGHKFGQWLDVMYLQCDI
jgi:phosphinothricin acetyltransferase